MDTPKTEARAYETSDLGTAAFVHMMGLKILGATRGNRGKFFFRFEDPEGRAENYALDYVNSECRKFDAAVRSLKKLTDPRKART